MSIGGVVFMLIQTVQKSTLISTYQSLQWNDDGGRLRHRYDGNAIIGTRFFFFK